MGRLWTGARLFHGRGTANETVSGHSLFTTPSWLRPCSHVAFPAWVNIHPAVFHATRLADAERHTSCEQVLCLVDSLHAFHSARNQRSMSSRAPLFRRQALEYYVQSRERTILPRLARPPVLLLLWILLGLAALAMLVAWLGRIPVYISGPGLVMEQTMLHHGHVVPTAMALVFVPVAPAHAVSIRAGTPVLLRIGTQGQIFTAAVEVVVPGILSPDQIQRRYAPGSKVSSLITGPSLVVSIKLDPAFASPAYAGSVIAAQVEVGSTSVLSSLFGSAQVVGG